MQAARTNLERRLSHRSDEYVIAQLAIVANEFKSDRTRAEWEVLYVDYADHLREFPAPIVHDVLAQHRRTRTWFPKLGELVPACEAQMCGEREDLRRIRVLLGAEEPRCFEQPDETGDDVRPRSREEVEALIASTRQRTGFRTPAELLRAHHAAELERQPPPEYREANDDQRQARAEALSRRLNSAGIG